MCACGIEPSSLVNEVGKGLSGKKTRKKNRCTLILKLDMYTHIYRYIGIYILILIYIYIYIYISVYGKRGPVCSVYIGIYL